MENASKALLIAGAVLICIVLISVGMIILNSTNDVTDQVGDIAASQAAESFNSQFTSYVGTQKGSAIKALMSKIEANNKVQDTTNGGAGHTIELDTTLTQSAVRNSTKYTVEITEYDNDGFVSGMSISQ